MPPAVAPTVDAAPPKSEKPPRRPLTKKKLVALLLGGVLLALAIGGTTLVVLKKRAAAAAALAEAEGAEPAGHHDGERSKTPPTYVPLEAFTVNLADKDAERFAQVGVTFELDDAHAVEQVKNYLPSIRNAILLLLAQQTSADLLGRAGKEQLAREIGRAATRAMGYDVPAEEPAVAADAASAAGGEQAIANQRPPRKAEPIGPIRRVHFANFIIQ
jgi:flagellar protein FliL